MVDVYNEDPVLKDLGLPVMEMDIEHGKYKNKKKIMKEHNVKYDIEEEED